MRPDDVRNMVLKTTPIGLKQADVEAALRDSFRRKWLVRHEGASALSKRHFTVPVVDGDYYLSSNFASVGIFGGTIVTVYFLFDEAGTLKDVIARVWQDSI